MYKEQEDISTRYTLVPITQPSHQAKLQAYMSQPQQQKNSFCRFYLRGLCMMKPSLCRFAHSFEQLQIESDDEQFVRNCNLYEKEKKKLYFQSKQDFQQKALFLIKNIEYFVLYQYQFSERWKKSPLAKKVYSYEDIKNQRDIRTKLKQTLHQQNWDKLINFLCQRYPKVDFTMSFLSKWFSKLGFEKPLTKSKFSDFIRYIVMAKGFKQVNIIMPPRLQKTVFLVNCNDETLPSTYLHEKIAEIEQIHLKAKQQYKKQLQQKSQLLPEEFVKRFMCRYFMAGNCEFTEDECKYAHSVDSLRFELGQQFTKRHRQTVKGREDRLNYVSLFRYALENINQNVTLEDINANSTMRINYRREMHLKLYSDFMKRLSEITQTQRFKLSMIEREYNGAGFNHSDENKFNQFQSAFWEIGYNVEELKLKDGKASYVYKIPPLQELDKHFLKQINLILQEEVRLIKENQQKNSKDLNLAIQKVSLAQSFQSFEQQVIPNESSQSHRPMILQSSLRKKLYHKQTQFTTPLHVYLRLKQKSLQQVIKQFVKNQSLIEHIFFQTNEQNYKKLVDLCKDFFKGKKQYIHKVQNIEVQIKSLHKDKINLNHYVNFKGYLNSALIDAGKKVYFLAFGNNSLVIDKGNMALHQKLNVKGKYGLKCYESKDEEKLLRLRNHKFTNQRIVIVDNHEALDYAEAFLLNCNKLGVDLEGRLKKSGYIDLIQVSAVFDGRKQIFVFDVFYIKKLQDSQLYTKLRQFLKLLFEDPFRVKILHDCKQDSTALKYLMDIQIKNVFDTSGMDIILSQKIIYEKWNKKDETNHHILKKIFQVKTPGLNTVFDKWSAPNGVNIFKESMKKRFHEEGTRTYFEQRPIDPQFLQYSVQDVEDLIDVYEAMKKEDSEKVSEIIGQIYSTFDLNQ